MGKLKFKAGLLYVFFRTSLQQILSFRFDFFSKILNLILHLIGSIGCILILFSKVEVINGWNLYETLTVIGVFNFMEGFKFVFLSPSLDSLSGLGGELWTGSFDHTLLKPVPLQFFISVRKWSPLSIIDVIISLIIIIFAAASIGNPVSAGSIVLFVAALISGIIILYSIMLILSSAAFWFLGTPMLWIFNNIIQLGRYPVGIYPGAFKFLLTWILPVGLIITVPTDLLLGKLSIINLSGPLIFAVIIYVIAVRFFKQSLKKYVSASS